MEITVTAFLFAKRNMDVNHSRFEIRDSGYEFQVLNLSVSETS